MYGLRKSAKRHFTTGRSASMASYNVGGYRKEPSFFHTMWEGTAKSPLSFIQFGRVSHKGW